VIGWLTVAAVVTTYDLWAIRTGRNTMSACYCRADPAQRALVLAGTGYLIAHLNGWMPKRYDLLRRFG